MGYFFSKTFLIQIIAMIIFIPLTIIAYFIRQEVLIMIILILEIFVLILFICLSIGEVHGCKGGDYYDSIDDQDEQ